MKKALLIIQNLEALYSGAKMYDDSEVIARSAELLQLGVPNALINRWLRYAYTAKQIEHVKQTIICDLKEFRFSPN